MENFFRFVDRFVLEEFSKPLQLPLILVALDEYHTIFKDLSHNSYLLDEGIKVNYEALDIEDLGTAYKDEYDCDVYYCLNEGSDIFE